MTLKGQSHGHLDFECHNICVVYIYLLVVYYHLNLDTKESLLGGRVLRCPSGLSCLQESGDLRMCGSQTDGNISRILVFLDNLLRFYQAFGVNLMWYVC